MIEIKRQGVPFLLGLGIGILVLLAILFLFGVEAFSGSKKWGKGDKPDVTQEKYPTLHLDDKDWVKVDLGSAQNFIKEKGIMVVTFIDEKGGFYIADRNGEKIRGWCRREGTQIPDGDCQKLKAERITNFNSLTTFTTEASPGCLSVEAKG